jgi:hypothetical protein
LEAESAVISAEREHTTITGRETRGSSSDFANDRSNPERVSSAKPRRSHFYPPDAIVEDSGVERVAGERDDDSALRHALVPKL